MSKTGNITLKKTHEALHPQYNYLNTVLYSLSLNRKMYFIVNLICRGKMFCFLNDLINILNMLL